MVFKMDLKNMMVYLALTIGTSSFLYEIYSRIKKKFLICLEKKESNGKKVYLNGISSTFPSRIYSQKEMRDMFIENYCQGEENLLTKDLDFINRVFNAAMIEKCHVNLSKNDLFKRMKREEYTSYIKKTILEMSCEAARDAINQTNGFQLNEITHLVFGTMTGSISAPSMDIFISKELQLNSNVKRLNVESMGCLTGFRLVGLCRDIAEQNSKNVVLLIVGDIRSALGNQLTPFISKETIDKSNVIISALFRDSCGAAIFSQRQSSSYIIDHRSEIIENTLELGRLKEFDDSSIHLYLSKELPYAVFNFLPNFIENLLFEHQICQDQCQFVVHTGGPKIIRGIGQCLNLKEEQLCASWFVMINYGNLSGSSNLVVLQHFISWKYSKIQPVHPNIIFPQDFDQYKYIVGLSFGPGIALECVLFKLE